MEPILASSDSPSPPPSAGSRASKLLRPLVPALALAIVVALSVIFVGLAQRVGWLLPQTPAPSTTVAGEAETMYTCAMHPDIRQPMPGKCPICGMELVLEKSSGPKEELAVTIDPVARRLIGIATDPVVARTLSRTVRAVGAINYDESSIKTITAYVPGRIERLFADYTGVKVNEGDEMAVLYSPDLYSAQSELLQARGFLDRSSDPSSSLAETQRALYEAARRKLIELGMTETQIEELEAEGQARTRLAIHAPRSGTVIEKLAVEGQYVSTGTPIYRVADLSVVWLMLDVFPEEAVGMRYGQLVRAEVQSLPGRAFHGRIAFVDPMVDERTRTVGVRVVIPNEQGLLRPGDYASAQVDLPLAGEGPVYDPELAGKWISPRHPQIVAEAAGTCPICSIELVPASEYGYAPEPVERDTVLTVPRSAVLMAGEHSVLYVEDPPASGRFEIRPLVLGPLTRDYAVILEGVAEGEQVATSGNFLIDSQMQLERNPSLIDPTRAIVAQRKTGPLELEVDVGTLGGAAGAQLERMYGAYFEVHAVLAADGAVSERQASQLREAATAAGAEESLSESRRDRFSTIAAASEHLHLQSLAEARASFQKISQAIVPLAAQLRGERADGPFFHFYCPMVEGGFGDWLQAAEPLANPYFGSQMLDCGDKVHKLPLGGQLATETDEETEEHE